MKKFLTIITLISTCIPAIHGMEARKISQRDCDNLKLLIEHADVEGFKLTFNAESLSTESLTALLHKICEVRMLVIKEIGALGDNDKNWSKVTEGVLATVGASIVGMYGFDGLRFNYDKLAEPDLFRGTMSTAYILRTKLLGYAVSLFFIGVGCKGLTYGLKTFEAGLNYKKYLQKQLANIDAIAVYIACEAARAIKKEMPELFLNSPKTIKK